MGGRRRSVASTAVVVVAGLVISTLAVLHEGYSKANVELNDGGVWVTQTAQALIGHLNYPSQVLDSFLDAESADIDLLQDGAGVLAFDPVAGATGQIDLSTSSYLGKGRINPGSQLAFRANTVAMIDAVNHGLYVTTLAGVRGLSAENSDPLATVGEGAAVAVSPHGAIFSVSPSGDLYTVDGLGSEPTATRLAEFGKDATLDLTAVGETPVVLDRTSGTLYVEGRSFVVPAAVGGTLQQAGPANDKVVIATPDALLLQPLDGSPAESVAPSLSGQGEPAEPVWLAGCAYGAWSRTGVYVRECGGTDNDRNEQLVDVKGAPTLKLRQNRNALVVNDVVTGDAWLIDSDEAVLVDNWNQITPDSDPDEDQQESEDESPQFKLPDRSQHNPPQAKPDSYGVRPGSSTILPVLENDIDLDGDLLTALPPATLPPFVDAVEPVSDGGALQVRLNPQASGTIVFEYTASDGRDGTSSAAVTLAVVPDQQNQKPRKKKTARQLTVELKAEVTYDVLNDWEDPDGDDLYLVSAQSDGGKDDVSFRSNGVVTFRENVGALGVRKVNLVVSDGKETAESTLEVSIRPKNSLQPLANSDRYATAVNQPITVSPLVNDLSPSGRALSLSKAEPDNCPGVAGQLPINSEAGSFVFAASQPGTCYVQYLVTDGPGASDGLIRIDVAASAADVAPPIAARDVALLPEGGQVLVDVLRNDTDPSGGLLVLQGVELDGVTDQISAEVLEHQTVRIKEINPLTAPLTIHYWVASGNLTARGELRILPVKLPEKLQAPVAVEDRAVVRAGDVVTIDVLANDYHPDGGEIVLLPELAEVPAPADGEIFIAENQLRFRAGSEAKTVKAVYTITDARGQYDESGLVTIQIVKPNTESNSVPRPEPVTARVLQGTTTRIPIPLDGIDPDGDSVELIGTTSAPEKGQVLVGDGWLVYRAFPTSIGVDSFSYQVRDRVGGKATGSVLVGIAAPSAQNQRPYTTDDEVTIRPGRMVSVPVVANDTDPDGDEIALSTKLVTDGLDAEVAGGRVLLSAPQQEGDFTVTYRVVDPYDSWQDGRLRVAVRTDAPLLAPIARDDRVQPAQIGGAAIEVPVLENDEDPDGVVDELRLTTGDPTASVTADRQLRIELLPTAQVILYSVTDSDGQSGQAFVFVPGTDTLVPSLRPDLEPIPVKAGETREIALADYVTVREGRRPRVADGDIKDGHAGGPVTAPDDGTISYPAAADYYGPDAVTVVVTDATGPDDADARQSTLSFPILVEPATNQSPTLRNTMVEVEAGGEAVELNLRRLSSDPDPDDLARLSYRVVSEPRGIPAKLDGFTLSVSAAADAGSDKLVVEVSDGTSAPSTGEVTVNVLPSLQELPMAVDDLEPQADQGKPVTVPVLRNDYNPFEEQHKPLTIVSAKRVSGRGTVEPTADAQQLIITPDADFVGDLVVSYTIADATGLPERQSQATVTVTVQGRPDQPLKPVVVSVGDEFAILEWRPPAPNGRPITSYEVSSVSGPKYAKSCQSTTCTLDGLTNAKEYTFSVVAVNEIGESDPSPASAVAFPDVRPEQPAPPTLEFGDESLTVSWKKPKNRGSAIIGYTLEITPGPPNSPSMVQDLQGTGFVWKGLRNGTSYRVRVTAYNLAEDPSDPSDYSAPETPAREPEPPGKPSTTPGKPIGDQRQLKVSWAPPSSDNGDPVKDYTLITRQGGSEVGRKTVDDTSTTVDVAVGTTPYTFEVTARNKAGDSKLSPRSEPRQAANPPDPVSGLSISPGDKEVKVTFKAGGLGGSGSSQVSYQYRVSPGGRTGKLPSGGGTIGGLANGTSYTVELRVTSDVDGVEPSEARTSNAATPFGKPFPPSVSAKVNGTSITFSWSPPASNGRPIDYLEISVDDGGWQNVGKGSGSREVGSGYSQNHSIKVRATDSEGQTSSAESASARTVDPPQPSISIYNDGYARKCDSDSTQDCYYFGVETRNFPDNVSCHTNHYPDIVITFGPNDRKRFASGAYAVYYAKRFQFTLTCGSVSWTGKMP